MTDESKYKMWDTVTAGAFAAAIIAGLVVGIFTGLLNGVYTFLIVTGVYLALSLYLKEGKKGSDGPLEMEGAVMGGVLLAGIGVCGFIYSYTSDVTLTAVCIIAVLIVSSAIMIIRNRRYL